MTSHENLDLESFKMPGPWPPAWWMELPSMMSNLVKDLPFGKEDKRYIAVLLAQATYLKECSESLRKFYEAIEGILR